MAQKPTHSSAYADAALEWELLVDIADGRIPVDEALDAGISVGHFGAPHTAVLWTQVVEYRLNAEAGEFRSAFRLASKLAADGDAKTADLLRKACREEALGREVLGGLGGEVGRLDTDRLEQLNRWRDTRALMHVAAAIDEALALSHPPAMVVADATERLAAVGVTEQRSNGRMVGDVLAERLEAYQHKAVTTTTGITDLDQRLNGGLRPGQLVIVGARPGIGKSTLALAMARAVAHTQKTVLFASLEMSPEELTDRLVAAEARVSLQQLQAGELGQRMQDRVNGVVHKVIDLPIVLDGDSTTVSGIRHSADRLARRGELGLVVVDYLQLLSPEGRGTDNRANDVATMSRGLKLLARQLGVPVLALSQLNRQVEYRANKAPGLADLRESGSIEQDADVVLMLHRGEDETGVVHMNIAKHRNGPLGKLDLAWLPETLEVCNLAGRF
jgi:replicative DNA helicase